MFGCVGKMVEGGILVFLEFLLSCKVLNCGCSGNYDTTLVVTCEKLWTNEVDVTAIVM